MKLAYSIAKGHKCGEPSEDWTHCYSNDTPAKHSLAKGKTVKENNSDEKILKI